MISIKIINAYIVTLNNTLEIIEHGCLCIENEIITYICTHEEGLHIEAETTIDAQGNVLMPGLINAHTHAGMNIFKGFADDLPLKEWLENHIFPIESEFATKENIAIGVKLAILEMIMSGTTCFADMYYFTEQTAQIADEFGIRAILGQAIIDFKGPDFATSTESIANTKKLMETYKNHNLIQIIPAPHSAYTCKSMTLKDCRELANQYNAPIHIHVSETIAEYNESLTQHNATPIRYLEELGVLEGKTIAAHCVYVSDEDRNILANKHVSVVNNPQSNLKLVSGIAPIPALRELQVNTCLGTDSAVSNNSLDMFQELKTSALIHKLNNANASVLNACEVLCSATRDAAKCLGLDSITGSLEVGKKADVIIINMNQPHLVPLYNIYSQLVYAVQGKDVDSVFINGKCVYMHSQFQNIDYFDIMLQAQIIANKIIDSRAN